MTKKKMNVKITVRVLQCPFCDKLNTATLVPHGDDLWYIICDAHKEGCGASTGRRVSALEVLNLWNTRNGLLVCEQDAHVKKYLKPKKGKKHGSNHNRRSR